MPVKVILNPTADLGNGVKHVTNIKEAAEPFGGCDLVLTEYPGHARLLAAEAAADGYDLVVAAGGDGTVNEVVNGMMESTTLPKLGVLPIGTGNDFAYALGSSREIPLATAAVFNGRKRSVDLALLEDDRGNKRLFANNLGVGFDANVVIRTAEMTRIHGFMKYLLGVLTTLARDFEPLALQMRFDREEMAQEVLFLSIGIGPRHGGGFLLTPEASTEDELLDSCTVTMLGRLRALSLLGTAIKGTHVTTPYVTMRQNREIVIRSHTPLPIHIDGEIYAVAGDGVHQIAVTCLPAAVEVVA